MCERTDVSLFDDGCVVVHAQVKQEIVREGFGTVPGESWTEDPFTWLEHASEHDSGAPGLEGKVEAWGRTKAGHMGAEISLRFDEDFWTGMGREKWEKLLTEGEWIVTGGINTKTVKTLAFAALHLAERENETVDVAPFKCCRKAVDMEAMQENDSSEDDDLRDVESDSEGSACERMDLGEHLEAVEAQTRRKYFNAPVAMGVAAAEAVQRACARLGRRELGRALARGSLSTITDDERAARLGAEQSLRSVLIRAALAEHPDAPGGGGSGDEPRGQRPGTGDTLQNEDILSRTAGRRKVMDDDDFMGCSDDDSVNGLDETDGADGRPLWATREWMGEVDRALEGMDGSDREHRKIIRETLGHFLSLVHGPPGTGK